MQNDLISRKELIERIVNRTGSPTVLFNTTEELNAYLEGCAFKQNDIIDIVNDIPTAYNLEKVLEELEEGKNSTYERCVKGMFDALFKDVINKISNGGRE